MPERTEVLLSDIDWKKNFFWYLRFQTKVWQQAEHTYHRFKNNRNEKQIIFWLVLVTYTCWNTDWWSDWTNANIKAIVKTWYSLWLKLWLSSEQFLACCVVTIDKSYCYRNIWGEERRELWYCGEFFCLKKSLPNSTFAWWMRVP